MNFGKSKNAANDHGSSMSFARFTSIKSSVSVYYIQLLISYQGMCNFGKLLHLQFVIIVGCFFSFSLCRATQAQCLGGLLTYFSAQSSNQFQQMAVWYALGLVSCAFVSTAFTNPFLLYAYQMGMQIRVICTSLIYRKVIHSIYVAISGF